MGLTAAIVGALVAALTGFAWLVGRSVVRQQVRRTMMDEVERRHASHVKKPVQRAPGQDRLGSSSQAGGGFGRVHLGVVHRHDPDFSELALLQELAGVVRDALQDKEHPWLGEGALASLRAGPRGRLRSRVQVGALSVHGVFADELWTNLELGFEALVEDEDGEISWREDRWRLRRRHGEGWQVATLSDSRRLLQLPEPPLLPLGPQGPGLLPAVDLDWPGFRARHPEVLEEAARLLEGLLRGEPVAGPGLARALALDRQRAEGRQLRVDRVQAVEVLRANTDATHHLVEVRLEVRAKAWLEGREPESFSSHHAALTLARPLDEARWSAEDLRWVSPPQPTG